MECHFYFLIAGDRLNVGLAQNFPGNLVGELYKCMLTVYVPQVEDSLADVIGPFCFQGGAGSDLPIKQRENLHLNIIYIQPALSLGKRVFTNGPRLLFYSFFSATAGLVLAVLMLW